MGVKTAEQVRREFIAFFEGKGHTAVASAPIVPPDDPTLMFTNAGMNQFKDVFLGTGSRPYRRAVDSQKCIRAGGKHNDLEEVGHDTYHHTFFEMLGNWSFGDYFKREAIAWAWELLTEVWGIDKRRLHATYFEGDQHEGLEPDTEARDLWAHVTDIDPSHVHPGDKKDNFWEMGDTGPCGPCSEIHIDLTPDQSGGKLVNAGDARVIEIWNLVFIQYNRDESGKLSPLPATHVDTGMGFERIVAVLQNKTSNYDTDVFAPIFAGIREVTGAPAYTGLLPDGARTDKQVMVDVSYRVIADHVRCLTFAMADGATPSNEGRGYVLRRILRRAVRYGRQYLGIHEPFLCRLVPVVVDAMGHAFPELKANPGRIAAFIRDEEESFIKTLDRGIALFEDAADRARQAGRSIISGDDAFKLHDTYGFPIDLTEVMARERGMSVDLAEYRELMEEARERARARGEGVADEFTELDRLAVKTADRATDESAKYAAELMCETFLTSFARNSRLGDRGSAEAGQSICFTTAQTCFYVEAGGQVSDTGKLVTETGEAEVVGVSRHSVDLGQGRKYDIVCHRARVVRGEIWPGSKCRLEVDRERRIPTMQNHTATHVLNWALREVLEIRGGGKVDQKGSLVDPDKTRFDFSHNKPLTPQEIEQVETLCREHVRADRPVYTKEVPEAEARKINTLRAVFGEKYPDMVRVVSVGADIDTMLGDPQNPEWMKYPVEFCGGTHVMRTGEIGVFVLTTEESVAKGIRRVVGIAGEKAQRAIDAGRCLIERAEKIKAGPADQVADGLADLQKMMADAEITLRDRFTLRQVVADLQQIAKQHSKQQAAESAGVVKDVRRKLLDGAERVDGSAIIVGELPEVPVEQIREAADWFRSQAGSAAVCLAVCTEGKPQLVAAMTDDLIQKGLKAGDLIKHIVGAIDGRGGGRPSLAQAGGTKPEGIPQALAAATEWIKKKLS